MKKRIYLLSGKMGSGKNYVAELLKKKLLEQDKTVTVTMFASKLKQMASEVFEPIGNYLKDELDILKRNFNKEILLTPHVINFNDKLTLKKEQFFEDKTQLSRLLLQALGTDIIRTHVDDSFWVKATGDYIMTHKTTDFIITDWRYENEFTELQRYLKENSLTSKYEIVLVNIQRQITRVSYIEAKLHDSENALNNFKKFDAVINNDDEEDNMYIINQLESIL